MAAPECEEMGKADGETQECTGAQKNLEECIMFFKGDSYGNEVIQEVT